MIRFVLPLAIAVGGFAVASPVLADVKEDYMAACMAASDDNTELCTCKTDQASKLVDEEMMGYLVIALADPEKFTALMKEGKVPEKVVQKWPFYVRDSNKVCIQPTT